MVQKALIPVITTLFLLLKQSGRPRGPQRGFCLHEVRVKGIRRKSDVAVRNGSQRHCFQI